MIWVFSNLQDCPSNIPLQQNHASTLSQIFPPTRNQVFKQMSLLEANLIQDTIYSNLGYSLSGSELRSRSESIRSHTSQHLLLRILYSWNEKVCSYCGESCFIYWNQDGFLLLWSRPSPASSFVSYAYLWLFLHHSQYPRYGLIINRRLDTGNVVHMVHIYSAVLFHCIDERSYNISRRWVKLEVIV